MAKLGYKHTKETKQKMRLAKLGKKHTEEHNKKISENNGMSMLGKKHSDETKKKMSLAKKGITPKFIPDNTGRVLSEETKKKIGDANRGRPSWHKGKKRSVEFRKKMSKIFKERFKNPENHPSWLGGKSFEPYAPEFNKKLKEQVKKRDNYTCQECNYEEKDLKYPLSIHHIDYNKKNNLLINLIALCNSCHSQTNFRREDWKKYFKNKLIEQYG